MRVAIASAVSAAGRDPDEPLLVAALAEAGARSTVAAWDDAAVDWAAFDLVVVRSTWDYTHRRDEFVAWARAVAGRTRLRNDAEVLAWNTEKTYLRDLAAAGVPVVPTTFLAPGDELRLPDVEGDLVVKPAVSAGSRNTGRFTAADGPAREHAARLLAAGHTVLAQPYQASIDVRGETSLVFFAGRFSHAVSRAALLVPDRSIEPDTSLPSTTTPLAEPVAAQRAAAEAALAAAPFDTAELLYARVDLVDGPDGRPLVMELELAEPAVFLGRAPGAAARFAAALVASVARA